MNTLRGPEADALLGIDDVLVARLKAMAAEGKSAESLVNYMAAAGVPKGGAHVALRRANVISPIEAKKIVHFHPAYAYRRQADEAFTDSLVEALDEIERSEAA